MSIKGLSKAASALALVGVVAPFLVQSVGAAEEPTSALKDVAGVSDYSGSQIIDSAAVSDATGSGKITGKSYAGIGFKSGDLILYQVPNFDFSMNNKIAAQKYNMISTKDSAESNRMAVIVDNRFTSANATSETATKYGWKLSAVAEDFKASEDSSLTLGVDDVDLSINTGQITAIVPESQNETGDASKIYKPTTNSANVNLGAGGNLLNAAGGVEVGSASDSKAPGPVALNFKDQASATLSVLPGNSTSTGIAKIVPGKHYHSDITWTLTAAPLS